MTVARICMHFLPLLFLFFFFFVVNPSNPYPTYLGRYTFRNVRCDVGFPRPPLSVSSVHYCFRSGFPLARALCRANFPHTLHSLPSLLLLAPPTDFPARFYQWPESLTNERAGRYAVGIVPNTIITSRHFIPWLVGLSKYGID